MVGRGSPPGMNMTLDIRPYRQTDRDALVRLWLDTGLVHPTNNPIRDIERKLCVNPDWLLVGETEGRIVASCMVGYEGHRGWINYLAVAPDFRDRGFGRRIMERAEELLASVGCPKINLQVRGTNRQVIEFYRRIGFSVDDTISLGKRLETDEPFGPAQ